MAEENSFVYGIIHIGSSSLSMRIVGKERNNFWGRSIY